MVGRFTRTVGIGLGIIDITLDAVIARTTDMDGTAGHLEELSAVDTVTDCLRYVNGCILHRKILTRLNAVLHVSCHVERSLLGKLRMSLDIEGTLL